jgi:hypothetical protein
MFVLFIFDEDVCCDLMIREVVVIAMGMTEMIEEKIEERMIEERMIEERMIEERMIEERMIEEDANEYMIVSIVLCVLERMGEKRMVYDLDI